jgi:hypothetical protein
MVHKPWRNSARWKEVKFKGHELGFLEKGIDSTQFLSTKIIYTSTTFVVNMGWERILPLEIYQNFNTSSTHKRMKVLA